MKTMGMKIFFAAFTLMVATTIFATKEKCTECSNGF